MVRAAATGFKISWSNSPLPSKSTSMSIGSNFLLMMLAECRGGLAQRFDQQARVLIAEHIVVAPVNLGEAGQEGK